MNSKSTFHSTTRISILGAAILLGSCASNQQPHPELVALQNRYSLVQSLDNASQQAGAELDETRDALAMGREAYAERDQDALAHYIFVADKTLDVAQARIDLSATNDRIASASSTREEMVLASRESELQSQQSELNSQERALATQQAALATQRGQLANQANQISQQEAELAEAERQLQQTQEQARLLAERLTEVTTKVTERGTILVLSDIVFDFDSAMLKPGSNRAIEEIADFLMAQDSTDIAIEGHTDSVGSDSYNDELSRERARAVHDALMQQGVASSQMDYAGMGEDYPVASNDTDAGRQQNRRVEIVIEGNQARPVMSTLQ